MKIITPLVLAVPVLLFASCDKGKQEAADSKDTKTAESAAKPYTLDYCLVSDEKLGEMGDPVVTVYKGQEFKFCCEDCLGTFEKDPDKYLALLKEKTAGKDAGADDHSGHQH